MKWIAGFLLLICMIGNPLYANMWVEPDSTKVQAFDASSPIDRTMEIKDHQRPAWVFSLGGINNLLIYIGFLGSFALSLPLTVISFVLFLGVAVLAWIWGIRGFRYLKDARLAKPKWRQIGQIAIGFGLFLATIPIVLLAFSAIFSTLAFIIFPILIAVGFIALLRNIQPV